MCVETTFLKDQLIQPIFVSDNLSNKKDIPGIPNNFVMNIKDSLKQIENDLKSNCKNYLIFIVPNKKKELNFNLDFQKEVLSFFL